MNNIKLIDEPLDLSKIYSSVVDPTCGAVSLFIGTTRDNFDGKNVTRLEYEAYEPMAVKSLEEIANDTRSKFGVIHVAIHHRLGVVPIGEASVIIAISSPHRDASLKAVSYTIDTLKANVPIFKKEFYCDEEDGQWKENVECSWASDKGYFKKCGHENMPICHYKENNNLSRVIDKSEIIVEGSDIITENQDKSILPSSDLVQITANTQEINRRIALFIKRKREQADLDNLQDFCFHGLPIVEKETSCARVDAQLIRRKGSQSHVKVHRVENAVGPQVQNQHSTISRNAEFLNEVSKEENPCSGGAQERIKNVEQFLGLSKNSSFDIFARLKAIEDRILYLETISPEYFTIGKEQPMENKHEVETSGITKKITTKDIKEKIVELEMKLQSKYGMHSIRND